MGTDLSWWDGTSSIIPSISFLVFGNIPERYLRLGANKCGLFVPWLMLNTAFPLRFSLVAPVFSLTSPLAHQVTCQRRARRTAGPPSAQTTRWTAGTTPTTPWSTRSARTWKLTSLPDVCLQSNWSEAVLFAGGVLQRRQSGLHHRLQRLAHFSDNRDHHPVSLPVRTACEMLLNVFFPSFGAINQAASRHFLHFIGVL